MNFKTIVMERYAVKGFDGRPVPQEKVDELMEMIRFAPTSFNLQPWRAMVIRDEKTKRNLEPAAGNQPQVSTSSHVFVFCANTDLETLADRLEGRGREAGIPSEKLKGFMGAVRGFIKRLSPEDRLSWAQRQTYIALANGMNGAKALGFDSCPMEGFDRGKVSEILGLPSHWVPTVLLPIGYANDTPRPKLRFTKEEMFFNEI